MCLSESLPSFQRFRIAALQHSQSTDSSDFESDNQVSLPIGISYTTFFVATIEATKLVATASL